MYTFRSVFAGLLLAVVACGGVGAPLVHEAMHAAERTAVRAAHDADGHHGGTGADGRAHVSDECPAPKPPLDRDCVFCHGLTGALVAEAATAPAPEPAVVTWDASPSVAATAADDAPTGRGPPVA